jgi:hypothetical protein
MKKIFAYIVTLYNKILNLFRKETTMYLQIQRDLQNIGREITNLNTNAVNINNLLVDLNKEKDTLEINEKQKQVQAAKEVLRSEILAKMHNLISITQIII